MRASCYLTFLFLLTLVNTVSGVPERGDCSFGNKYPCGYFFPKEDWEWELNDYDIDHTTGKAGGGYLNVNATVKVNTTRVSSPSFLPSGDVSKCVTFWYRLSGPEVNALRVYVHRPSKLDQKDVMWETKEKTDRIWYFGRVPIIQSSLYKVTFEMEHASGKVKKKAASYASLDDIVFTPGPCSVIPDSAKTENAPKPFPPVRKLPAITPQNSPHNCTFEKNNMCNWIHSTGNKFNWTLRRGGSVNRNSGPRNDHTNGQFNNGLKGYYLYIVPNGDNLGQKARFESKTIKPDEAKCLVFWYHMWGSYIDTLRVLLRVNGKETLPLWVRQKAQGKRWNRAIISFQMQKDFQIIFEAVASPLSIVSNIAVDDIAVLPSGCPVDEDFCDFEDGAMCGYKASSFDWIHSGGPLVASDSPIDYDHTYNSEYGHYLAVQNNSLQTEFSSTLNLNPRPFKRDKCLRFWYYMSRNTSTQLYVTSSSTQDEHLFNSDVGATNFANTWQVAQVDLDPSSEHDVTLSFTVNAAKSETFVVGLDDVEIRNGFCGYAGDCNFEYGDECVWSNGFDDNFDWTLQNGKIDTQFSGPSYDHTFENYNGTYIYIEASKPQRPGNKARLYSNGFPNTTPKMCLHFWYNMNGNTIGRLTIFQKFANGDEVGLWQLKGAQSPNWLYGKVPFSGENGPYRLMFEATVGGEWGDIALDDIVVSENDCQMTPSEAIYVPPVTTSPEPPTTTPHCDFERNNCGWREGESSIGVPWQIDPARRVGFQIRDHTTDSEYGNVLYFSTSFQAGNKVSATAVNDVQRRSSPKGACVQFWYILASGELSRLYIGATYNNVRHNESFTELYSDNWHFGQLNISENVDYTLDFEFVMTPKYNLPVYVLVDDILLRNESCQPLGACDFENDFCGWEIFDSKNFKLKWLRRSAETPSKFSGPSVDKTLETADGFYLFLDSAFSRTGSASIISPELKTVNATACFSFWYYMWGSEVGELSVSVVLSNGRTATVFSKEGDTGKDWHRAHLEIHDITPTFHLVIKGTLNGFKDGAIAIDEFSINPGKCAEENIEIVTTTTTTPRIITRPVTTPISSTTKSTATPTSTQSTENSTQKPSSSSTQPSVSSVTTKKIEPTPTTNQPKSSPHSSSTKSTTRKPIVSCGNGKFMEVMYRHRMTASQSEETAGVLTRKRITIDQVFFEYKCTNRK